MEFRIKPFLKNNYPRTGLLIKGSSPSAWLREMEFLGITLDKVKSFAIPAQEPNVLYGCFIIFNSETIHETGKNIRFQCVENKLFIPENTIFYPEINPEEWKNIAADFIIMHPDFGLVKLSEQIHWVSLLQDSEKSDSKIRKPLNGVRIPQKIESYAVEIDDEKVLEELQKQRTEEEWMQNLPFDMKKVLAGNKKEIEKYLKYIEKYPERVVDLGVPLNVLGTSRGDGLGKFKFNSWWEKLFRRKDSHEHSAAGSRDYRWVLWGVWIAIIIGRFIWELNKNDSGSSSATKISFSEMIWLVFMMIGSVGLYSYCVKRKTLSTGGSNVPNGIKIFLILILAAMLIYLFYPLIEMFGYNWFVWVLIICVVLVLYRLFNEDKTILKTEEDE